MQVTCPTMLYMTSQQLSGIGTKAHHSLDQHQTEKKEAKNDNAELNREHLPVYKAVRQNYPNKLE